jgi:hypothetical protein
MFSVISLLGAHLHLCTPGPMAGVFKAHCRRPIVFSSHSALLAAYSLSIILSKGWKHASVALFSSWRSAPGLLVIRCCCTQLLGCRWMLVWSGLSTAHSRNHRLDNWPWNFGVIPLCTDVGIFLCDNRFPSNSDEAACVHMPRRYLHGENDPHMIE